MKRQSQNIISDNDITVTTNNSIGNNMGDIVASHESRLHGLESNVKWLYKYGGMGSGGGGGGGGTTTWKVVATCTTTGEVLSNTNTLKLNGPGGNETYHNKSISDTSGSTPVSNLSDLDNNHPGWKENYKSANIIFTNNNA